MAITTQDFEALTDDLQSIFNETARRKVAENVGFKIYDVRDTNRLNHTHQVLHGLAGVRKMTEGEDFPKVHGKQGDDITWTQEQYGGMVSITKKMRKFDLHNQIKSVVKSISQDAFDKVDQSLADALLGGFESSYQDPYGDVKSSVTPDGLRLFHSNHTNPITDETFGNIIKKDGVEHPQLSREAIRQAQVDAKTHKDPNNIMRPINLDTLIVAPEKVDLAERLIKSQYLPGSANNDINPLYGKVKIVEWPRLSENSEGDDTKEYWFLVDSQAAKEETLKCLFAEKPSLDAPDLVYPNKNWDYTLDFFYTIGKGYPAYVYGSKGTA